MDIKYYIGKDEIYKNSPLNVFCWNVLMNYSKDVVIRVLEKKCFYVDERCCDDTGSTGR